MKKVLLFSTMIVSMAALILVGYTKPTPAWEWPKLVTISTQMAPGPMNAISFGWGSVLEKSTGARVRVVSEEIGSLRLRYVKDGRFDMCTEGDAGAVLTLEGRGEHATRRGGPFPMRLFWNCMASSNGLMVRGDSPIKTMRDLRPGVKIAVHPGGIIRQSVRAYAAWAGLMEKDINFLEVGSIMSAMRAVMDGKADCCPGAADAPWSFELEATPHGIRWLEVDPKKEPEAAARYWEVMPTNVFGMAAPTACRSAQGIVLEKVYQLYFVNASADPELIYNLAKWLDKNFDAYKRAHPAAGGMRFDAFRDRLDTAFIPVHRGVIKYLKEKGAWSANDDKRQAYNVKLVNRYVKAYKDAIAAAEAKGIKVDPMNKSWMALWADHKKDIPAFKAINEIQ